MTIHEDELPIGLGSPEGSTARQPRSNGVAEVDSSLPTRAGTRSRHGPLLPDRSGKGPVSKKGLFFLDHGPASTVIPELESTVPWMGWPKRRYKLFWGPIGKTDRRPKLTRKNQLDYEIDYLEERLQQLANLTQITIGVHNCIGGSGKSTTAIYLASIIHDLTSVTTYAMSATSNLRTTALAKYAGVYVEDSDGQAQRVHELVDLPKREIDLRTVGKMVRRSKFGVRVVAEDRPNVLVKSEGFKTPQFIKVADALHAVSELIVFDCGNDDVEPGSIPLEVARREDVLVLPANVEIPLSLENLAVELSIYSSDDSPDAVSSSTSVKRTGRQIPTREKAERAVVVFTNASPGQKTEDFVGYLPDGFKGVALTVPKDSYIRSGDPSQVKHVSPADPYEIDKYTTYRAFLEAAVAAFEMGARLQGIQLPEPEFAAS